LNHFTSPDFWKLLYELPEDIQALARKNYELLKADPHHPSLHFKRVGDYWSVRVGKSYRALATELEDGVLWGWIGSHDDYDRIIS
jgi:mRNA-degrading endonuclease RelE of RelBE toxin-antitoxin system